MMFKCNGCGREFETVGGTLSYGDVSVGDSGASARNSGVYAEYHKTLCPRCQYVMKDILLNSDLSEQWSSYDWPLMGQEYLEEY